MKLADLHENKKSAKEFKGWLYGHSAYGKWLTDQGFPNPTHEKPGEVYTNVHGEKDRADPDKPFGVVTYRPKKSEMCYTSKEEALKNVPKSGDWQVLQMITGEIIKEPKFTEGA